MDGMMKCTECEELRKKINRIEYEDLKEIREDIQEIREDVVKHHVLLEQNISSSEKLNDTLNTVQHTMIQLTESMKSNNEVTVALSNKVSKLETKIDKIEDDSKLDMRDWWKKNWVNVILLTGVVAYLVLGQYVKF